MTWRMMIVMTGLSLIMIGAAMPMSNPSPQLGDPLPGLTPDELARFTQGKAVFSRDFTPDTGLGPFFNNTSCAQCHEDPVTGGAGRQASEWTTRALRPEGDRSGFANLCHWRLCDRAGC